MNTKKYNTKNMLQKQEQERQGQLISKLDKLNKECEAQVIINHERDLEYMWEAQL